MFINKTSLLDRRQDTASVEPSQPLSLVYFIDYDLDAIGWYALGHHNPQLFFASLNPRDRRFLLPQAVKHAWALITDRHIEISHAPFEGADPITFIESW